MVLRLLKSAVHQITLAMLYSVWLCIAHQMRSSRRLPMSQGHEQFRMRLQGILTGLMDFRDVQESAADELEPAFWLDMPPVSTKSWEYEDVTPRATKRIGDARLQEISLSHETLRTYLRKNKLINSWLDPSLLVTFPNHLWFDIYSDILIASNKVSDQWRILKEAMKASTSFDQKHHLRVQTLYDGILERMISTASSSKNVCRQSHAVTCYSKPYRVW